MAAIQQSVTVAVLPERVWDAVVDFEARPRWSSRVKQAQIVDGGPLREGSRIRLQVNRDRFTATVVEMRPKERLVLLVRFPGVRAHHMYDVRREGDGATLTLTARYGGLWGGLIGRLMAGSVRRDLNDELAALKRAAEAGASG